MRTVFLDTVGLIALWDEDDQWHAAATQAMSLLMSERCQFISSSFVLLECGNAAARRRYRSEVVLIREELGRAGNLYEPTADETVSAWQAYADGTPGGAGIVDQFSFALVRRFSLTDAFTNDNHFRAAGFHVLF